MGRESRQLKLALLRCRGEGWQLRVHQMDGLTLDPPVHESRLAEPMIAGLRRLSDEAEVPIEAIDGLGLLDISGDAVGLAQQLALATGVTTLCRFVPNAASRSSAVTSAAGDWFLFRSAKCHRWVVELGQVLRLTILPPRTMPSGVLTFDVGPGNRFLNELVHQLSQGRYSIDPSGHFAVQGQQDEEILAHWSSHPFLLQSPPRFLDAGSFGELFIESSMVMARERRRAAKDLLCTANHFVARCLKDAVGRFLPTPDPTDEVFLVGGGVRNGLVRKLIEEALLPRETRTPIDIGVLDEVRSAAHAALLAFMAMENLSANMFDHSAIDDRVLGTIIPGSRDHWDRWVCHLADRFDADARRAA